MIWLRYFFSQLKRVTSVDVEFSIQTKSGNNIHTITENFVPKEKIIMPYSDFEWRKWEKVIKDKYATEFNLKADELLTKYKIKERKKIHNGCLDSGDYIVKCTWGICVNNEWLNYKEFRTYFRDNKSEDKQ